MTTKVIQATATDVEADLLVSSLGGDVTVVLAKVTAKSEGDSVTFTTSPSDAPIVGDPVTVTIEYEASSERVDAAQTGL